MILPESFYHKPTPVVARSLLGMELVHESPEGKTVGRIVETEAYVSHDDPANHASRGQSQRNAAMFGPPGHSYIYLIYGMYHCFNVVTGSIGVGEAVLIRSLEPKEGRELMQQRRGKPTDLCNGPGKLVIAMGLNQTHNGCDLTQPPLYIQKGEPVAQTDIITTTRVGITQARELLLRFYHKDSPFISKP